MLGAVIGDVVGSVYEWRNLKKKDFPLWSDKNHFTDDSVMTFATADALMRPCTSEEELAENATRCYRNWGRAYPNAGYGGKFFSWLYESNPKPYGSYGNGSAMRVSPCAYAGKTEEEVKVLSRVVTSVSHNHPEGIKGAEATAVAIYLARTGKTKEEIEARIKRDYYPLGFTLDEIRPEYRFDSTCQGSVPQAIEAFLESTDFEDAIRNAVSIGGDSDTIAAITGSIAEAYYGIPAPIAKKVLSYLPGRMIKTLGAFTERFMTK